MEEFRRFFPCILNASDGTKCGILFSPGVMRALAKTHRPSQHDRTKEGDHTGVYLTLSDQTETQKTVERTTKIKDRSDNGG